MNLNELNKITDPLNLTELMPVLFLGHGSPMNAIEDNEFSKGWKEIGRPLPRPSAILCISAHWETRGTLVTVMEKPATIHDFGGFPQELFNVQYPAPGSPQLARQVKSSVAKADVGLDEKWGLDHGAWSILNHLYPKADIPVVQLSLDYTQTPQYHYDLARELSGLRNRSILIIGSGNMVHNLRMVAWDKIREPEFGFDWAIDASEKMKQFILSGDHKSLINYQSQGKFFNLAIPTPDHYLPLLYALALQEKDETLSLFNDKAVMGSLTMTSVKIG
ncbi:MAG: 4,5-DOPA dioxygenase extradiol [Bacteroidia bacterium]|nr:4,5-DOPA dioxygenase extradiol [Bacteroidia bacterium]